MSTETPTPQATEEAYRRLVEMSPDLVLLCDAAGRILYANLVGVEMLGHDSPREVAGRNLMDYVHADSRAHVKAQLAELMEEMRELPFVEERFCRRDGTCFAGEMMAFPFMHEGADVAHLVIRDATKRKESEALQRRLRHRLMAAVALVLLLLLGTGGYSGYRYSESSRFCGTLCHSVMGHRHRQHEGSAHAHVSCAQCHIGAGAAWYVKAKFSGLHQVYATLARTYPTPIPAPIENLRPAAETCMDCHSPQVFHGNRTWVSRRVPEDGGPRDPEVTALTLHVGGHLAQDRGFAGIHWHADPGLKVEYQALDPRRMRIARIRVTTRDGRRTHYAAATLPEPPADTPWRVMDCSDCHNRVAHHQTGPGQAVDELLLDGSLPPLPGLRSAALAALTARYDSLAAARRGLQAGLETALGPGLQPRERALLPGVAEVLYQKALAPNINPDLGIAWDTYPDHESHADGGGCFRCHDGGHRSAEGVPVRQDCDLCHTILLDRVRSSRIDARMRQVIYSK